MNIILKKIKLLKCSLIIGTDHNLDLLKNDRHSETQNFLENILCNEMIPCITRPTRITKSSETLRDNIITSRNIFDSLTCGIMISDISDHFPCLLMWPNALSNKKKYIEFESHKLDDKHLPNIKSDLSKDWSKLLSTDNDVNQNFQLFHNEITTVLNTYTETKKVKLSNKKIIKEPWLTKGVIASSNKQLLLYKHWLQNKDAKLYDKYKQYRDILCK